jgi:hypothetical protein
MSLEFGNQLSVTRLSRAPPRSGLGTSLAAFGPRATAFLNDVRQYLGALKGIPRKASTGGDPQVPPEEDHPATDGIWNDANFWMMFMH